MRFEGNAALAIKEEWPRNESIWKYTKEFMKSYPYARPHFIKRE